jgi:hypothetical protein
LPVIRRQILMIVLALWLRGVAVAHGGSAVHT